MREFALLHKVGAANDNITIGEYGMDAIIWLLRLLAFFVLVGAIIRVQFQG